MPIQQGYYNTLHPGYEPTPALQPLSNINAEVDNPFKDYTDQFSYEDMEGFLDEIYNQYQDEIGRTAKEDISEFSKGATSRLTSRGITSGSVLDDVIESGSTEIGKNKFNVLGQLKTGKAGQKLNLQDIFNKRKLQTTSLGANLDLSNVANELRQALGIAGAYQQNRAMDIQEDNQEGFWDDLMSGIGDFASLIPGLAELGLFSGGAAAGGASAIPLAAAASDISLKENLIKVNEENGFNIYEFNYKGNPKRYRGVVAQEVMKTMPNAVIDIMGTLFVDYSKIGIKFTEV